MSKKYVLGIVPNKAGLTDNQQANIKARLTFIAKTLGPDITIEVWTPLTDVDKKQSGASHHITGMRMPVAGILMQTLPARPSSERTTPEYLHLFTQLMARGCDEIWCLPAAMSAAALSRSTVSRLYHLGAGLPDHSKARIFKLLHPATPPDEPTKKKQPQVKGAPRK